MGKKHHQKFTLKSRTKKSLAHSFLAQDFTDSHDLMITPDSKQLSKETKRWLSSLALHLPKRQYSCSFSNLVAIAHKLALLPAEYFVGEQRKLLAALIARINYALERNIELPLKKGYALLFHALIKLPLDFLRYQHIFATVACKCLEPFFALEPTTKIIKNMGLTPQSLWILAAIAHLQFPKDAKIRELFAKIQSFLTSCPQEISELGSATQSILTAKIRKLLSPEIKSELRTEYPVGIYHLDIALPEQRIAIEIDGKQHYVNRRLQNSNIVRDFIIEHMFGLSTIRLPHFEYGRALHYGILSSYLLHKLSVHSSILRSNAGTLQQASRIWYGCFFKSKLKIEPKKTTHKKHLALTYEKSF